MDFSWTNYPDKPIKELHWEIELLTYFSLKNASLFNNQQVRIETKKTLNLLVWKFLVWIEATKLRL